MRTAAALLLALISVNAVLAGEPASASSLSTAQGSGDGIASSSVATQSTGGSIHGEAHSNAYAKSEAKSSIVKILVVAAAKVKKDGNAQAVAQGSGEACAKAVAVAWASTATFIVSDGSGTSGCAKAEGSGRAEASAMAQVFVDAVAVAENELGYALGVVSAEALAGGSAEAFAEATSKACLQGEGYAASYQNSFARAIVTAYVRACAQALATVDGDHREAVTYGDASSEYLEKEQESYTSGGSKVLAKGGKGFGYSTGTAESDLSTKYVNQRTGEVEDGPIAKTAGKTFAGAFNGFGGHGSSPSGSGGQNHGGSFGGHGSYVPSCSSCGLGSCCNPVNGGYQDTCYYCSKRNCRATYYAEGSGHYYLFKGGFFGDRKCLC